MSRPATDTEERLFDEALTLFATKGYAATSVREIIETVGLTKPVLYYYCENKLDLFVKLIKRVHCEADRELEAQVHADREATEKLRSILHGTFAFCRTDWRVPRLMYAAAFGPRIPEIDEVMRNSANHRYSLIREIVTQGTRDRSLKPHDPDVLALSFCSLVDHPVNLFTGDSVEVERLSPELAEAMFSVFIGGATESSRASSTTLSDSQSGTPVEATSKTL